MTAYVIFDVEINDPKRYQEFMSGVKPALEQAGRDTLCAAGLTRFMKETGSRAGLYCSNFRPSPHGSHFTTGRPIRD